MHAMYYDFHVVAIDIAPKLLYIDREVGFLKGKRKINKIQLSFNCFV